MKMDDKKMVVMDIDGVLADFTSQIDSYLFEKYGAAAVREWTNYSIEGRYADRPDILRDAIEFVNDPNSYYSLDPIPDGIEFAEQLLYYNMNIWFLSSRPKTAYEPTVRWLKKNLAKYNKTLGVTVTGSQSAKFARMEDTSIRDLIGFVVDDSPEVIGHASQLGIDAYCWAQPWNKGVYPRIVPGDAIKFSDGTATDFWRHVL